MKKNKTNFVTKNDFYLSQFTLQQIRGKRSGSSNVLESRFKKIHCTSNQPVLPNEQTGTRSDNPIHLNPYI